MPPPVNTGVYWPHPPGPTIPTPTNGNASLVPKGTTEAWLLPALTVSRLTIRLTAMQRDPYVLESPRYLVEGDLPTYTVTYEGALAVTSPSAKIYKDETDTTSTNFPAGSASASGNVVTLPTLAALVGGERYVIALTATVDGQVTVRKCLLIVAAAGAE